MYIAQFIHTKGLGGAETMVLALTKALNTAGIPTAIHAFRSSWIYHEAIRLGVPAVAIPKRLEDLISIRKMFKFGKEYSKFLRGRGVTVLHSHLYGPTLRGAVAAYRAGVKHVATQHDNYSVSDKWSRSIWLNVAGFLNTKLVMISNQMLKHYTKHGVNEDYCSIVHNGVDESKFFRAEKNLRKIWRERIGATENDIVYISTGRLEEVKGFDILIDSFAVLKGMFFKLVILGDGSMRPILEDKVKRYGLEENIKFIGSVNNVKDWLAVADVFVLSSRDEGLSCSIIEAMFSSLPVVATNVGGNVELVDDLFGGYLSSTAQTIAKELRRMQMTSRDKHKIMGEYNYKKAKSMFTLDKMVKAYSEIYSS